MQARDGRWWALLALTGCAALLTTAQAADRGETARALQDIRFRVAPDLNSAVAGFLRRDQAVTILERQGEFARIRRADGFEGFLKHKYLIAVEPSPGAPVVAPPQATAPIVIEQAITTVAPPESVSAPVASAVGLGASRWSFDLGVGTARSEVTAADLRSALDNAGFSAQVDDVDRDASHLLLRVGYRLLPALSAELGVEWIDDYRFRLSSDTAQPQALLEVVADTLPAAGSGISAALAYSFERGAFSAQARIGAYATLDSRLEASLQGQAYKLDQSAQSLLLGANAAWRFAPEWHLGLELQRLDLNAELLQTQVFLRYSP